jgi:hypothetical protein
MSAASIARGYRLVAATPAQRTERDDLRPVHQPAFPGEK